MGVYDQVERLEAEERLDGPVDAIAQRVPDALRSGPARELLAGTWLGHALHPLLTDVPIGCWTSATMIDLAGPRRWHQASTALTGAGVLAALPTAITGVVEWLDTGREQRRVGVVHAAANTVALALYTTSFVAKLRGRRGLGIATGAAGGLAASVGGYLGAHLSYARGVGVDKVTEHRDLSGPVAVRVVDGLDVAEATEGARYLVVRSERGEVAVPDRCTRCGGSLERETGDRLRCPVDGSVFAATDGVVAQGPATTPLPRFSLSGDGSARTLVRIDPAAAAAAAANR